MSENRGYKKVLDFIAEIHGKFGSGDFIYRGTSQVHNEDDSINSSIYRNYRKWKNEPVFTGGFLPVDIEKEIVEGARRLFRPETSAIEILTEIRHFGGDTTLIDFSHNMMVALFFACVGGIEEDGELIAYSSQNLIKLKEIDYNERRVHPCIVEPVRTERTQARVLAQSSVFVHAPLGYLYKYNGFSRSVVIPKDKKTLVLDYLSGVHNISSRTIYNDLHGFLENTKNHETAMLHFYHGLSKFSLKDYQGAIESFSDAIQFKHDYAEAFYYRSGAEFACQNFDAAMNGINLAIHFRDGYADAFLLRGVIKSALGDYASAIEDFDEAIRLKPDYAEAYENRAIAWDALGEAEKTAADHRKAEELRRQQGKGSSGEGGGAPEE